MNDCILWAGAVGKGGYGNTYHQGRYVNAHKRAWLLAGREVPEGYELDHKCEVKLCINVGHLQVVTPGLNHRLIQIRRGTCRRGHPLTDQYEWKGKVYCRPCRREYMKKYEITNPRSGRI